MEDPQDMDGSDGGSNPIMEWYTLAGITTVTVLIGLIGFRLTKDELLLRRKRLIIGN
jgi:hypothetical protein